MGVKKTYSAKQTTEKFSVKTSTSYMGFPRLLLAIETPSLKGIFGNNFVDKLGHLLI
jgi:hypothetical protein